MNINKQLLAEWLKNGHDTLESGVPRHPEFVFRISGEWMGWAQFLGCEPSRELTLQDRIED